MSGSAPAWNACCTVVGSEDSEIPAWNAWFTSLCTLASLTVELAGDEAAAELPVPPVDAVDEVLLDDEHAPAARAIRTAPTTAVSGRQAAVRCESGRPGVMPRASRLISPFAFIAQSSLNAC